MGRDEVPETLDRLGRALADVVALVEQAAGTEHVAGLIRTAHGALRAATRRLMGPSLGAPADPDTVVTWLHEVSGLVNGIVGWSWVLGRRDPDEATRVRAVEAIERNAKLLMEFLSRPPPGLIREPRVRRRK
jgi:hypothetical protein